MSEFGGKPDFWDGAGGGAGAIPALTTGLKGSGTTCDVTITGCRRRGSLVAGVAAAAEGTLEGEAAAGGADVVVAAGGAVAVVVGVAAGGAAVGVSLGCGDDP